MPCSQLRAFARSGKPVGALGLALAALLGLSLAWGTAWAQIGSPPAEAPATAAPAAEQAAPAAEQAAQPVTVMREPERLQHKPSGFWTSGRPAVGGAYRYRLLGVGAAVLVLTAIVMVWVVRRHPQRRA